MDDHILVVEDEENIRQLLVFNLETAGYTVSEATDGLQALEQVREQRPSLVLLDLMLPGLDGLEVCKDLKQDKRTTAIPIIMLTAKSEEIDKVIGLELGADDYMTKPFGIRELLARVKAVLRRSQKEKGAEGELVAGALHFFFPQYQVLLAGEKLELTPKEYELLKFLVIHAGRVFSRDQLLEKIWGYEYIGDTRTVDVHIRHLRIKLGTEMADCIETVRGVGYRFYTSPE